MLTPKQKAILLSELKIKSHPEKKLVCGDFEITKNYLRQTHNRTKNRASEALKDLIFLAENYPEYVRVEDLAKLVSAKLAHGKIDLKDRKRKPRKMRSKKYNSWVQIAGVLHTENGAPLIKPEIPKKVWLAFEILQSVHAALSNLTIFDEWRVIRLVKEGEKIDVYFAPLATEKGDPNSLDKKPLSRADIIRSENHALLKIGTVNPENLKIIVLEYANSNHKKP